MAGQQATGKLKVFISYSRADEAFADELRLGLEDKGYTIEIDKHSIRQGEEWKARLRQLIAACDTVVFVLSPDSARSETCRWEVDEAHRQAKRIVPVLHRGLQEAPRGKRPDGSPWPEGPAKAPERLTLINYPRFDEGRSFMTGLRGLVQALEDDLDWIDAHSRLATRARDWDKDGRPANRLMSGSDIAAAKKLVETRKPTAPEMLPVQHDFIQASVAHEAAQASARERDLEERRRLAEEALAQSRRAERRTRLGLAVALALMLLATGLGGMAWWQRGESLVNAERAVTAQKEAEKQRVEAVAEKKRADELRRQSEQQRTLAEQRREVLDEVMASAMNTVFQVKDKKDKDAAGKLREETAVEDASADAWVKRILVQVEQRLGQDDPTVATAATNLAVIYQRQGNTKEAISLYQRSLTIWEKNWGPEHPRVAAVLASLAAVYQQDGNYGAAEPLYKRSLSIGEKIFGPDHPEIGVTQNNLAVLYANSGRYEEAIPLLKRSLALREKALGPDHPDVGVSINNLAGLYRNQGRYAEAEPLYKRTVSIVEKVLGPDHPSVATSLNNLAELYQDQGRHAEAEPLYQRSLVISEKALGPEHPDVGMSLNNLAGLYESQGRYAEAEPLYKRAVSIFEKALGPDDPSVKRIRDREQRNSRSKQ